MLKLFIQTIVIGYVLFGLACAQKHNHTIKENIKLNVVQNNSPTFDDFLGINGFEWDFLDKSGSRVNKKQLENMRSFTGFRHYMDWERIESEKGVYTFNPTHSGGFNYDSVYLACKENNIEVLACLKNTPAWLANTYPKDKQSADVVPVPYGSDRLNPRSYLYQAKAAFQFAARYGNNKIIDRKLVDVSQTPRWPHDEANDIKVGLGYVHYIECGNEVDKDWLGPGIQQSAEQYAANLSAFYDGDKGRLGKNVGIKSADPTMVVVMSGLSAPTPNYVVGMINWCRKHRGLKADGSVDLCFDIINYHFYNCDAVLEGDERTVGKAPELSTAAKVADSFVAMSKKYANSMPVWITESGYDINPKSPQRAIKIGNKPVLITQADWMIRSAFLYTRHQLKKSFFYMVDDVNVNDPIQYSSSGFIDRDNKKRPVADYFLQVKKLLGAYSYKQTISSDPVVDIYTKGNKDIYILYVPDEKGREAFYNLNPGKSSAIRINYLVPGANQMRSETIHVTKPAFKIKVTETPIFVEILN
ncbi:hypothetical protein FO440_13420 [Mucilaginibacter corticis]|uniref:Glycoside hydrolase family 42 N-terminal domain-containing protein n=1 Tax=Mucilaginibacter corticis TaxID=2597670 RepID=A0A556MLR4_9SPHI|nr:hypothetical protein [Mucilaginibacter corticis]TSJ40739.1 hypothetical protein FO440_13420 [Mucilaginibacter corticis]